MHKNNPNQIFFVFRQRLPGLRNKIFVFITDGHRFGTIIFSQYSMGLYVEGDFFIATPRGKRGWTANDKGDACLLKSN